MTTNNTIYTLVDSQGNKPASISAQALIDAGLLPANQAKPSKHVVCQAKRKDGKPCQGSAQKGRPFCYVHRTYKPSKPSQQAKPSQTINDEHKQASKAANVKISQARQGKARIKRHTVKQVIKRLNRPGAFQMYWQHGPKSQTKSRILSALWQESIDTIQIRRNKQGKVTGRLLVVLSKQGKETSQRYSIDYEQAKLQRYYVR